MNKRLGHWTTERIANTVLAVMVAVTAVLFVAFYALGYQRPYADDPSFNAPLLTDCVLALMLLLIIATVAIGVWTIVRSVKMRRHQERVVNGIPVARWSFAVAAGTFLLLVLTYLLGSSEAIAVNGQLFTDSLWLKTADMFVWTAAVLLIAAITIVAYGYVRNRNGKEVR